MCFAKETVYDHYGAQRVYSPNIFLFEKWFRSALRKNIFSAFRLKLKMVLQFAVTDLYDAVIFWISLGKGISEEKLSGENIV